MSRYYDIYKTNQDKAMELKEQQKIVREYQMSGGKDEYPKTHMFDIHAAVWEVIRKLEGGIYGWNGEDAQACLAKIHELREANWKGIKKYEAACDSVMEAMRESQVHYANIALDAVNHFDTGDALAWGWNSVGEWWNSLL